MSVYQIGNGYYGIDGEGVKIDEETHAHIAVAFKEAMAIPTEKLNIKLADRSPLPDQNSKPEL